MMKGSPAKLALAVIAIYLLVGAFPATSALVPHGDEKSSWHVDCIHGLTRILGRKEGNFGCQNVIVSKKIVPTRSLKVTSKSPPPPPTKNTATSLGATVSPPVAA
ncbi:hypothetical protein ABKV19_020498 [Rosa sericea]